MADSDVMEIQHGELDLLQRLLSERFGDTSVAIRPLAPVLQEDEAQPVESDSARPPSTAFPLFASRPKPSVRESKDATSSIENKDSKSKKRKRAMEANAANLPLVRLVSPEPIYAGPGRGRIL